MGETRGALRAVAEDRKATRRLQLSVAGVSATLLALQVALTRVLSVVLHFHMVFLVLSAAMLGVGLPGAWLLWRRPGPPTAGRALLVAAVSIPTSVALLLRFGSPDQARTLTLAVACLLMPFLSLGAAAAALLIEARGSAFRRVYAADLLGGAVGALGTIGLLDWVAAPVLVASLVWPVTLVVIGLGRRARKEAIASVCASVVVLVFVAWGGSFQVRFTKDYDEARVLGRVILERWSSTTRLAVFDRLFFSSKDEFPTWGPGKKAPPSNHRSYWIEQDGGAGTPVLQFDGDFRKLDSLDYDVTSLGYQLRPAKSVLIVGPGGGRDILTALRGGADRVRGVEVNRGMLELMNGPLGDFSGHVYSLPGVEVEFAEARSYLAARDEQYDALQLSLIDSFSATAAGAHALSEGYLYTVEAMQTYLRKLRPRGVLSITRWAGFEASRLLGTVSAAAAAEGWQPVGDHILAEGAANKVTVLASPTPFSGKERAEARESAEARGFGPYYPGGNAREIDCVESHGSRCARAPAVDDDPFFFVKESAFQASDAGNVGLAPIRELAEFSLLGLVLSVFLPLYRTRRTVSPRAFVGASYYALIGIAFMMVEVGLAHRFVEYVGHPTTSAAVVLTGLLVGAGAGSYLLPHRAARGWLLGTSLVVGATGLAAPVIFVHTRALGPVVRGTVAGVLAAATAFQLGAWFPAGLLRFGEKRMAWFWLVNGTASVVGGMLALGVAVDFGFRALFMSAAAVYLAAAGLLLVEPEETTPEPGVADG